MIRVKTFTTQLRIFHAMHEIADLDRAVNDFLAKEGIRTVVSVGDSVTAGGDGKSIGILRVVAYEDPAGTARERYQEKLETALKEWGAQIEGVREKGEKLGKEARGKLQVQIEELRKRQETARARLQDLSRSGGETWDDLRGRAEGALEELRKGIEQAVSRLRRR